jgi:exodeoxyribonuclease V alpha subunit
MAVQQQLPGSQEPQAGPAAMSVEVFAVRYRSGDGNFAVVEAIDSSGAPVTLTGPIAYLHAGEELEVEGCWRDHPRHGLRFEVSQACHREPTTEAGLLAALGAIKHIGPTGAAFLYERYGAETLAVVDNAPKQRLREVPGIGRARIDEAVRSWDEQRSQRALRMFLASHGVAAAVASRIHRAWGSGSIDQLQRDPYCVTTLPGIGFQTADALARALGMSADSAMRLEAGLCHALTEAELDGHCYLPAGQLHVRAARLLSADADPHSDAVAISAELLALRVSDLCAGGRLVAEPAAAGADADGSKDEQEDSTRIYLAEMHATERRLGGYVSELAGTAPTALSDGTERPAGGAFVPTDEQWAAVRLALAHRLSILTGGPGTGKTTSMRVLVDEVHRGGGRVRLCAPTGKAARRLAAATGQPATTIHRLLEWVPGMGFARDRENRLSGIGLLIIDEASMLSVRLAEALFAAVDDETHVLLVGDVDQLAAVGPGRVLEDLIGSGLVPVTALHRVFRQAQRSLIVRAAHAINEGRLPSKVPLAEFADPSDDAESPIRDFFVIEREREADLFAEVMSLACGRVASHFDLDAQIDVQVLAPMRRGPLGIDALNGALREQLNPDGAALAGTPLRAGDRVIQTRNDYEHELMNGEVCLVAGLDGERVKLIGDDGRTLLLPPAALDTLELAYAISIHKSQGSQAPAIVLALARSHRIMLTRNLLYTAVTRAESACVVVCQPGALELALARRDARRRHTRLAEIVAWGSEQML